MSDIKTTEPDFAKVNFVNPREGEDSEAFRKRQARAAWKRRQARKREREASAESVNGMHEKNARLVPRRK